MKIAIGNDHTAVQLKQHVISHLHARGIETLDMGTDSTTSVDYPVFAERVARAVLSGDADRGILICGTGLGMSIAANKIEGIRAAACSDPYSAAMARRHNNAHILAFGARVVGPELALMIVDAYVDADYEPRHQRRIDMISELEHGGTLQ